MNQFEIEISVRLVADDIEDAGEQADALCDIIASRDGWDASWSEVIPVATPEQ